MKNLGYYNGTYDLIENIKIPMLDRACFFGDGVYDVTYSRNHIIYNLDAHIERFFNSAKLLEIVISHTQNELKHLLNDMVSKVDCGEQFIYWQITRGSGTRSHAFPNAVANMWIMLRPCNVTDTYKKIKLITVPDTRFLHCNIKTINLLPNVMAAQKAEQANCDEAVFHRDARVTECAHSNIHIIKNGVFQTAPCDHLILPGIARQNLIQVCNESKIAVLESPFTITELFDADEVIVSSSGSFCLAANEIDKLPVGGKAPEILKILQDALVKDFEEKTNKVDKS